MKEVKDYIWRLFHDVEESPQVVEQREELTAHVIDHMFDIMATGIDEEQAFEKAVVYLDNLDELIATIMRPRSTT
ncbi:MAG: permease prefix domain 1-containing protein [Treponema sp.]|jgi:hypothetical protein|nr:permease prefix domain 1-containing protein [Treponema sp.]